MHALKPIDENAVIRAAKETGIIITAEEHQTGALAWRVSGMITSARDLYGIPVITGSIGVRDRFGESGAPWELIKEFEVSAEHIANKAVELKEIQQPLPRRIDLKPLSVEPVGLACVPCLPSRKHGASSRFDRNH